MQSCASAESLMSPGKKKEIDRNYSDETFYTDSSEDIRSKCKSAATLLQKRRQLRPINGSGNPYVSSTRLMTLASPSKNNVSMITQKIMSAKLLRVKQLQNELTDAHFQLNELSTENRILRTLQKRQDMALKKYEGTQAELPQLIRSHNEEVRALKAKLKQVKAQYRELENRLKIREGELAALREQHKHLLKLSKDKHLGEREQLQQQLDQLQDLLKEQDKKIQTLTRKAMLEGKNFKHQLTTEVARHKKTTKELDIALERVAQLESVLEAKEKYIAVNMGRTHSFHASSMVSFGPQSRFRLYQHANENVIQGSVAENSEQLCDPVRDHGDSEVPSQEISSSQKVSVYQNMQLQTQQKRSLQRQRVHIGPDEEEEEDDDYEQPMLSESIGSNTCPSQISTTESVENLSKDTTDNCREDGIKLELHSRALQNSVKYSEYGLEGDETLQKPLKSEARPALRRYSISGDSNLVPDEPTPLSERRGSLNDGSEAKMKEHSSLPNTFDSDCRDFSRKNSIFLAQKPMNDIDNFVSPSSRAIEMPTVVPTRDTKTSRKKSDDPTDRNIRSSTDLTDMTVEEGRLHLKSINRSWNEIQNRIRDETIRAQSMIERFDEDREDLDKYIGKPSRHAEAYDKNNLLAALKAIDEGNDLDFADALERRNSLLQCKSKRVEYRTSAHTIENLHRGIPSRTSVSSSVIDKPRKDHNIYWDDDTNNSSNIVTKDISISKPKENLTQSVLGSQK